VKIFTYIYLALASSSWRLSQT